MEIAVLYKFSHISISLHVNWLPLYIFISQLSVFQKTANVKTNGREKRYTNSPELIVYAEDLRRSVVSASTLKGEDGRRLRLLCRRVELRRCIISHAEAEYSSSSPSSSKIQYNNSYTHRNLKKYRPAIDIFFMSVMLSTSMVLPSSLFTWTEQLSLRLPSTSSSRITKVHNSN